MKRTAFLFLWIGAPIVLLILLEIGYFLFMLPVENRIKKADAIIVFRGSQARTKAGYELAKSRWAKYLVLSPATEQQTRKYARTFGLPDDVGHIIEPKARTTFENAVYTRRIIEAKGLKSIILLTSDYHMPRSYFLLKMQVLGKGITILPYQVTKENRNEPGNPSTDYRAKILYNEILELWGSIMEQTLYWIRGKLPQQSIKSQRVVKSMKSLILFDVQPGY